MNESRQVSHSYEMKSRRICRILRVLILRLTHIHIKWDHEDHQVFFGFDHVVRYYKIYQPKFEGSLGSGCRDIAISNSGKTQTQYFSHQNLNRHSFFVFESNCVILLDICQKLQRTQSSVQVR